MTFNALAISNDESFKNLPYSSFNSPLIRMGGYVGGALVECLNVPYISLNSMIGLPNYCSAGLGVLFGLAIEYYISLSNFNKSNEQKPATAPIAVILLAKDSPLTVDVFRYDAFRELAKTHQIAIKILHSKEDIKSAMQEVVNKTKRPIDLVIFSGHGNDFEFCIGDQGYGLEDVANDSAFSLVAQDGKIVFYSCCIGAWLAPHVASLKKRVVLAATESINMFGSYLGFCKDCNEVRFHCFNVGGTGEQTAKEFKPNSISLPCQHVKQSISSQIFFKICNFFYRQ